MKIIIQTATYYSYAWQKTW